MKRYNYNQTLMSHTEVKNGEWIKYEDFAQLWKNWIYKRQELSNIIKDLTIQINEMDEIICLLKEKPGEDK